MSLTYRQQYQFARNYLHDDDLAQDAVQEIYILALKNIKTERTESIRRMASADQPPRVL